MSSAFEIEIIGGGLAGCEAAWRAAEKGATVRLWEMKPQRFSPAHKLESLGELVCSNSLRAINPENAVGLLKEEMRHLNSIVMASADKSSIAAGGALAVDRELFSLELSRFIESHPNIKVERAEVVKWPDGDAPVVVAAGPLASDALVKLLEELLLRPGLNFYDALAPILAYDSLDLDKIYLGNRYEEEGEGDYLNCPFTREEFENFQAALISADEAAPRAFEKQKFFEACLPIEVMARRGARTLTFGPMKPVGLNDPKTGRRPYAVVQLRRENISGSAWNMVGFQTRLSRPAQDKVFKMIPGLQNVEFLRYGAIHRNTYLDAPKILDDYQRVCGLERFFIAGQIAGVEGYVESAAHGLWVGENVFRAARGLELLSLPATTALGALLGHLKAWEGKKDFSPSNVNFGLFDPPPSDVSKNERSSWRLSKARNEFGNILKIIDRG